MDPNLPSDPSPPATGRGLTRRDAGAAIAMLGAGFALGVCGSCGPVKSPRVSVRGSTRPRLVPTVGRVDVVPGRTLVTPVRVEGPISAEAAPRLRLEGGRELDASLVWIGVETDTQAPSTWLPAFERWVVAGPGDSAIPASIGAWHLVAEMPADPSARGLELNSRTVAVNWLADPDTLRPANADEQWQPWTIGTALPQPDPQLLAPEWRSPLRLWHARLVATSLGRAGSTPGIWRVRGDPTILDRLAALIEARWQVGLARLWYADGGVCRQLLDTLGRTTELAPGTHAPAWPTDADALDALLFDLLDPRLKGAALADRARAWIESMPQSVAWVEDDAAELLGQESEPLVRLRTANLGSDPQLVWTSGDRDFRVGEPTTVAAGAVAEIAVPAGAGVPITGGRTFTVRCGDEASTVAAIERIPIRPPGVQCGPLLRDLTLNSWLEADSTGGVPDVASVSAVLLYRDLSGSSPSGWSAFVECAAPAVAPAAPAPATAPAADADTSDALAAALDDAGVVPSRVEVPDDEVVLWFGRRDRSAAVLRVHRTGVVRDDRSPGNETVYEVTDEQDRWSVSVPVPREAIEPGQMLRLGITRQDARGERTSWPRRLMPWQDEPSRVAIDLKTWNGLPGS